jgi:hypothetical protein
MGGLRQLGPAETKRAKERSVGLDLCGFLQAKAAKIRILKVFVSNSSLSRERAQAATSSPLRSWGEKPIFCPFATSVRGPFFQKGNWAAGSAWNPPALNRIGFRRAVSL